MRAKTPNNKKSLEVFGMIIPSPVGNLLAYALDEALVGLDFADEKYDICDKPNEILLQTQKELDEYFAGLRKSFDVPISPCGSDFQLAVWEVLSDINYGSTISYKQEALLISNQKACRAVANANAKNPISIIIPCHRVILSDGKIGGYSGGVWRKEFLLELEKGANLRSNSFK